jgi:hypothetical protein
MEILIWGILVLGWLLTMVGGVWILIVAFRESVVWGLCVMFLPIAEPIFIFIHWGQCWRPLLISLFGMATAVAAVFAMPNSLLSEGEEGFFERMPSAGFNLAEMWPQMSNRVVKATVEELAPLAVGDCCADVLRKCGKPIGKGTGKGGVVWHYADRTITFADGQTVSLIER